jgi:membrane protein DedA with SNARE-associated domain
MLRPRRMNMLHWLHTLLPHIPHYGYVLVFVVVFLNNIGGPLPGEAILLGAGFILGRTADSLWEPTFSKKKRKRKLSSSWAAI